MKVRNFERKEWRNDPDLVEPDLVYMVDELSSFMKRNYNHPPCIIRVAYDTYGHSNDSQHYVTPAEPLARAVDLYFKEIPLLYQFLAAERFPFTGIGCYPYWQITTRIRPETKVPEERSIPIPGLHLDVRRLPNNCGARWWRDDKGEYKQIDKEFFYALGMLNERDFRI